jgi:beta-xylosidase
MPAHRGLRAALLAAAIAGACAAPAFAQPPMAPGVWMPDQGNGTYVNPILAGDYSDPDVVRIGEDYYLTASSFANVPGLPVLHSRDLVNWTLVGHALTRLPQAHHDVPRRGGGVWAPAIRHHDGLFRIFWGDPDFGIYTVTAEDPAGPWSDPILVDNPGGAIDPAPFWDDDGQGWIVYSYAKSRSGKINLVALKQLDDSGTRAVGEERIIVDGDTLAQVETSDGPKTWVVIEGGKLYKRDGWYWLFAPAGGVKGGWQGVFRARDIAGPYEARNVLDQGDTPVNGPHQGGWVDTPQGEHWFVHFSDADAYGRRVHLQPMTWNADGWPLIGAPQPGTHRGQPVLTHAKPALPTQPATAPVVDDSFEDGFHLGWQWQSNPAADCHDASAKGVLRLKSASSPANLWEAGHVLSQKLPGMTFSATATLDFAPVAIGERAGLTLFGASYGWIGLEHTADGTRLVQVTREDAAGQGEARSVVAEGAIDGPVQLRVDVAPVEVAVAPPADPTRYWPSMERAHHARAQFHYSLDGDTWTALGDPVNVLPGRWVGSQLGLFAQSPAGTPAFTATRVGHADFVDFRVR